MSTYKDYINFPCMGPSHLGMARPQVAHRGTTSDKKGSCEYTE